MTTPSYLGAAQPQPSGGDSLIARIGAFLGSGETPPYAGAAQPASASTGALLRPATPGYAAAPVREQSADSNAEAQADEEQEASACQLDPEALASGHIAIVIPRGT
ncbi:hypothetical protein BH11MYX2_BH11MYX2_36860 [soil metagenome]